MFKRLGLAFIVLILVACSSEHSDPAACKAGMAGCACDGGSCESGLVCLAERCVSTDGDQDAEPVEGDKESEAVEGESVSEAEETDSDESEMPDADRDGVDGEELGEAEETDETVLPQAPWFACGAADAPSGTTVVTAFNRVDHYFNGSEDNFRQVDKAVEFPATGSWKTVIMKMELSCPADQLCDQWDRYANIFLVKNPGAGEEVFELTRYITPFKVGLCTLTDVTIFAELLKGTQTLRSFIDTWVGPSSPSGYGHGWRVSISFIFYPGPVSSPPQLVNLWPYLGPEIGNPANPIAAQVPEKRLTLPPGIKSARLRLIGTGHGQGNQDNCGEFCALNEVVTVNGQAFPVNPWRSDCAQNPLGPKQAGSWRYTRNGFCPGAAVIPNVVDISQAIKPGQENSFAFAVQTLDGSVYENGCRPGNGGESNTCAGCVFDSAAGNCDYNSGNHTMPNIQLSVQLVTAE